MNCADDELLPPLKIPDALGELALEREYTWERASGKQPLRVQIDRPRKLEDDGPYICCWSFSPDPLSLGLRHQCGEDQMQAHTLALVALEADLKAVMEKSGEPVYWLDPGLDLVHNHDMTARLSIAGILIACSDYIRRSDMPAPLRQDLDATLDWAESLRSDAARRAAAAPMQRDPVLHQALAYIDANVGAAVNVAVLCEHLGRSRRWLEYAFRKELGCTPLAYITRVRIGHALRMLKRRPRPTLAAIAADCGFSSPAQLRRAYRNVTGENLRLNS
ncbi:MAG: Xylose operon regulatory protein [Verrucomicrobiota bacterium]